LLPRNISPKHFGHATVLSLDPQNWQRVLSDETAAPQFGQFSDSDSMRI